MKNVTITILSILLVTELFVLPVGAQVATWDDASTVAVAWVEQIIQNKGHWGGSDWAYVYDIQEFKRGDRVIGYFCDVKPVGFIIVSLRKELAPIKAYSEESNLDPESEEGMTKILKIKMEGILNAIEEPIYLYGADAGPHMQASLEIDYRPVWDELCGQIGLLSEHLSFGPVPLNYQGGEPWLLSSQWDQGDPYNRQCPTPAEVGSDDCAQAHCAVGCTSLAGAQVMRYWAWPPWYDWANMPDVLWWDSPSEEIAAVAQLCHFVGLMSGANYCTNGCATGASLGDAWGDDLRDAFEEFFRYHVAADAEERDDYSPDGWFNLIKRQLDLNRPLPYRIYLPRHDVGHVIVVDGWQIVGGTKQYHMNWGHGPGAMHETGQLKNSWYTLDGIHGSERDEEEILMFLYPKQAVGIVLSAIYLREPSFPYRYFDQDTVGDASTFMPGQNLQLLPGITVRCSSTTGLFIRFLGDSANNTRLFSIKGDQGGGLVAGIRIHNGEIRMYNEGSLKFH